MNTITLRLSQKEVDYLSEVASEHKIFKGDSHEVSLGKTVKKIINWCQFNKININDICNSINNNTDNDLKKMVEHIHMSIPNIIYLARTQAILSANKLTKEEAHHIKRQSIDYLNATCGDFQNIQYNHVRFSMNNMGIKSAPISKEKSEWKLP